MSRALGRKSYLITKLHIFKAYCLPKNILHFLTSGIENTQITNKCTFDTLCSYGSEFGLSFSSVRSELRNVLLFGGTTNQQASKKRVTVVSTSRLLVFSGASSSKSRWKDNKRDSTILLRGPTFVHYQTSSTTDNLLKNKVQIEEVGHKWTKNTILMGNSNIYLGRYKCGT